MSKSSPRSLVEYIMAAIDEAVPGRGREIYWNGWNAFNDAVERENRAVRERELARLVPELPLDLPETAK